MTDRTIELQQPGVAAHQADGPVIRRTGITQQLRPHQAPRLAPNG